MDRNASEALAELCGRTFYRKPVLKVSWLVGPILPLFVIYDDPILLSLVEGYTVIKLLDNGTGVRSKLPSAIPSSMKIWQRSIINVALFTLKSPLNVAHKRGS